MSATPCLSLLYGMDTASWYAWLALRRRVSMSAIGSVIVMMWFFLALVSPCPQLRRDDLQRVEVVTRRTWSRREARRGAPSPEGRCGTGRTSGRRPWAG